MGKCRDRAEVEILSLGQQQDGEQQLDGEVERVEESEEWRVEQWEAARRRELFNEAKEMAEEVGV